MTKPLTLTPLTKTVHVAAPIDRAFELFTARLADWWPLRTHSVGAGDALDVRMQCWVGGQIVETMRDGSTAIWGTVTDWSAPNLVGFSWHPGRSAAEATQVEVRFSASPTART